MANGKGNDFGFSLWKTESGDLYTQYHFLFLYMKKKKKF